MTSIRVSRTMFQEYHLEVAEALVQIGNPAFGKAVQQDLVSQLEHLGITFPNLRRRVRQGFSFYKLPGVPGISCTTRTMMSVFG